MCFLLKKIHNKGGKYQTRWFPGGDKILQMSIEKVEKSKKGQSTKDKVQLCSLSFVLCPFLYFSLFMTCVPRAKAFSMLPVVSMTSSLAERLSR